MYLVRVEIDLTQDKPLRVGGARVVREKGKYVYFYQGEGKKDKPMAKTMLHRMLMDGPARGRCFILSELESMSAVRGSEPVRLVAVELLEEMDFRMQRCAVRMNEIRDALEAMKE